MTPLENLRTLHAAMLEAQHEYNRADPDVVHIAHAEYKAAKFRYNVAAGEYVAALLDAPQ